jgi:hypothetical protein
MQCACTQLAPPQKRRARESETYSKVNWCALDRND